MLAARRDQLTQRNCPTVAELARPIAELVSAVAGRRRVHAGQQPIARKHFGELLTLRELGREAEQLSHVGGHRQRAWLTHRRRRDTRETRSVHLARAILGNGIHRQAAQGAIVEHQHRALA